MFITKSAWRGRSPGQAQAQKCTPFFARKIAKKTIPSAKAVLRIA
jgi:hypothetical protein